MEEALIVLAADDASAAEEAQREVQALGGRVTQVYGQGVFIIEGASESLSRLAALPGVVGFYHGTVPEEVPERLDETAQLGITAWNQRHTPSYQEAKRQRKGEGLSWDHPDFEREG